jgi:hypothetical protein
VRKKKKKEKEKKRHYPSNDSKKDETENPDVFFLTKFKPSRITGYS